MPVFQKFVPRRSGFRVGALQKNRARFSSGEINCVTLCFRGSCAIYAGIKTPALQALARVFQVQRFRVLFFSENKMNAFVFPVSNGAMKLKSFFAALALVAVAAIATPFSHAAGAPQSLDQILATAAAKQKPVLLEFTGSDWCPPCMMMDKSVFGTPEFKKFADEELVYVKLEFLRKTQQDPAVVANNNALAQRFGVQGFPTMILLSPDGKKLAEQVGGVGGGAPAFIEWVKKNAQKK